MDMHSLIPRDIMFRGMLFDLYANTARHNMRRAIKLDELKVSVWLNSNKIESTLRKNVGCARFLENNLICMILTKGTKKLLFFPSIMSS